MDKREPLNENNEDFKAQATRDWTPGELDAVSFIGLLSAFFVANYFTIKDVKVEFSKGGGLISSLTQADIDAVPALQALSVDVEDVKAVGYWFATQIDDDGKVFDTIAPRMNRLRRISST